MGRFIVTSGGGELEAQQWLKKHSWRGGQAACCKECRCVWGEWSTTDWVKVSLQYNNQCLTGMFLSTVKYPFGTGICLGFSFFNFT